MKDDPLWSGKETPAVRVTLGRLVESSLTVFLLLQLQHITFSKEKFAKVLVNNFFSKYMDHLIIKRFLRNPTLMKVKK